MEHGTDTAITATATDASMPVTVWCNPESTKDLHVGVNHKVPCTAKDAQDNEAQCNVLVTVTGALRLAPR